LLFPQTHSQSLLAVAVLVVLVESLVRTETTRCFRRLHLLGAVGEVLTLTPVGETAVAVAAARVVTQLIRVVVLVHQVKATTVALGVETTALVAAVVVALGQLAAMPVSILLVLVVLVQPVQSLVLP